MNSAPALPWRQSLHSGGVKSCGCGPLPFKQLVGAAASDLQVWAYMRSLLQLDARSRATVSFPPISTRTAQTFLSLAGVLLAAAMVGVYGARLGGAAGGVAGAALLCAH